MRITIPSFLEETGRPVGRFFRVGRQLVSYLGPGFFVTVGFIDPGNWATNVAAGSEFGYRLLWVVALSTAVLILWQHMSAHLGIVTGKCLAEAIPRNFNARTTYFFGSTAMAACAATALAEVIGAAIGLNVLFGVPIKVGVVSASVFVLAVVLMQGYSRLEKLIVGFVGAIGLSYLIELFLVNPDWRSAVLGTVVPSLDSNSILIAMGVLGAVVMPHNIYLHSEVIQNRQWHGKSAQETRRLLRFEFLDTLLAMLVGMAINSAMIIVSAAVFHRHGIQVDELSQAAATLEPIAGKLARTLFGVALVFAGISSMITGGIAGGTVFSGFLGKQTHLESKWFRAGLIITVASAAVIALLVRDTFQALILSQVCLSVQLPFTMLPLFLLTSSRRVMGSYTNGPMENSLMVVTGLIIVGLNIALILHIFGLGF